MIENEKIYYLTNNSFIALEIIWNTVDLLKADNTVLVNKINLVS